MGTKGKETGEDWAAQEERDGLGRTVLLYSIRHTGWLRPCKYRRELLASSPYTNQPAWVSSRTQSCSFQRGAAHAEMELDQSRRSWQQGGGVIMRPKVITPVVGSPTATYLRLSRGCGFTFSPSLKQRQLLVFVVVQKVRFLVLVCSHMRLASPFKLGASLSLPRISTKHSHFQLAIDVSYSQVPSLGLF